MKAACTDGISHGHPDVLAEHVPVRHLGAQRGVVRERSGGRKLIGPALGDGGQLRVEGESGQAGRGAGRVGSGPEVTRRAGECRRGERSRADEGGRSDGDGGDEPTQARAGSGWREPQSA